MNVYVPNVRKPSLEMVIYYVTKEKCMVLKLECEKCNGKFKRKRNPDQHNAAVVATTSVMFNFTLPRRKIIIYEKPHLKIANIKLKRTRSTVQYPE